MEATNTRTDDERSESKEKTDDPFYQNAATYWSGIPATIDGMLGGFGFVSSIDIKSSSNFLKNLFKCKTPPGNKRALDCGAGIGRISKYLLLERFEKVDLVEQNPAFIEQAATFIGVNKHLGNMFCSGLQNFTPEPNCYDVIWCQWVLGHLIDEDLTHFLHKCKTSLRPNGVIVVKENVTRDGKPEIDETDSSVTRSLTDLRSVLESTGLKCIKVQKQERFPQVLYPVYMFALRPTNSAPTNAEQTTRNNQKGQISELIHPVKEKPGEKETTDPHTVESQCNLGNQIEEKAS